MKNTSFRDKLKIYTFLILIILILIYAFFRFYNYISGPKINIYYPKPYQTIYEDTFIINGNIKNAKNIYINEREIFMDENGNFAEKLIAKSPYTTITVKAVDKYGKEKSKILEIGH